MQIVTTARGSFVDLIKCLLIIMLELVLIVIWLLYVMIQYFENDNS